MPYHRQWAAYQFEILNNSPKAHKLLKPNYYKNKLHSMIDVQFIYCTASDFISESIQLLSDPVLRKQKFENKQSWFWIIFALAFKLIVMQRMSCDSEIAVMLSISNLNGQIFFSSFFVLLSTFLHPKMKSSPSFFLLFHSDSIFEKNVHELKGSRHKKKQTFWAQANIPLNLAQMIKLFLKIPKRVSDLSSEQQKKILI